MTKYVGIFSKSMNGIQYIVQMYRYILVLFFSFVTDSTAGMIVAMLLFLIPSKPPQFLCGFRRQKQGNY